MDLTVFRATCMVQKKTGALYQEGRMSVLDLWFTGHLWNEVF